MTEFQVNMLVLGLVLVGFAFSFIVVPRLRRRLGFPDQPKPKKGADFLFTTVPPEQRGTPGQRQAPQAAFQPHVDAQAWLAGTANVQTIKLSTLAEADNTLVAGPKGAGKTTVLRTIIYARSGDENIALDPHASPGKWPCMTIGGGLEWGDINTAMIRMQDDMRLRFKELAAGTTREGAFPRRSYVGDEFLSIVQELDGKGTIAGDVKVHAGKLLISRLTQGRKVGESILIASQNDTVEALGIQGNANLKACFDYIVFLGALVSTRARYHGCPPEIIAASTKAERPAVVWNPERNTWYMLEYDLRPVREGEILSVSASIAAGMNIPVSGGIEDRANIPQYTSTNTSVPVLHTTQPSLDDQIKSLHAQGLGQNKIIERLGLKGSKQERIARVKQALGSDYVDAA